MEVLYSGMRVRFMGWRELPGGGRGAEWRRRGGGVGGGMGNPRRGALLGLPLAPTAGEPNNPRAQGARPGGPTVSGAPQARPGKKPTPGTAINQGYAVWAKQVNDAGGLLGHQVQL